MVALDDGDEERRRLAGEAALGHAWDWFALHAKQRMQCVHFFLLAMAFLVAAFVTAVKDHHVVAVGIAVLGLAVTDWFHRLEIRTRELVKAGEAAMEVLEERLARTAEVPDVGIVRRVENPGTPNTSYGDVLRVLYRTTRGAFVLGLLYAVYQVGGGTRLVASVYRYGAPGLLTDPVRLSGLGLGLGVLAALFLAFLPPPHFSRFTKEGAARVEWTGRQTRWGRGLWWASYSGPVLLAASFVAQYLAWRAGAGGG